MVRIEAVMKIALIWGFWQHYHEARWRALDTSLARSGGSTVPISLCGVGRLGHDVEISAQLSERLVRLTEDPVLGDENGRWAAQSLVEALDVYQPDVVAITGYSSRSSRAALAWCRKHRKGAVLMMETQRRDLNRRWWKELYKRYLLAGFDAVLAGGVSHAAYATELGMCPELIRLGYDVVDNEFWRQHADSARREGDLLRARLALPKHYILAVGRFIPKKNFTGLLRAYAAYLRATPAATVWNLVIVGRGPEEPMLRAAAAQVPLQGKVHFRGYAVAKDMAAYYALANLFILPSGFEEQWGLVVNEAMASGTAVLVSDICGCAADLIVPGQTGLTFDPKDESQLARLLTSATRGGLPLSDWARVGREHINNFSPEKFAASLIELSALSLSRAAQRQLSLWPRLALFS